MTELPLELRIEQFDENEAFQELQDVARHMHLEIEIGRRKLPSIRSESARSFLNATFSAMASLLDAMNAYLGEV